MARKKGNEDVFWHYKGVAYSMDKDGYVEIITSGSDIILDPGEVAHLAWFLNKYRRRWDG